MIFAMAQGDDFRNGARRRFPQWRKAMIFTMARGDRFPRHFTVLRQSVVLR